MFKNYSNGQLIVMFLAAKKRFQQQTPPPPLALRWLAELSLALKERNCSGFHGWQDFSNQPVGQWPKDLDLVHTRN
jgi:hypothetical protein